MSDGDIGKIKEEYGAEDKVIWGELWTVDGAEKKICWRNTL